MYNVTIKGRRFKAPTLKEISEHYAAARDASGEGASTFREVFVSKTGDKRFSARVSYNARIWEGDKLSFDPYARS